MQDAAEMEEWIHIPQGTTKSADQEETMMPLLSTATATATATADDGSLSDPKKGEAITDNIKRLRRENKKLRRQNLGMELILLNHALETAQLQLSTKTLDMEAAMDGSRYASVWRGWNSRAVASLRCFLPTAWNAWEESREKERYALAAVAACKTELVYS